MKEKTKEERDSAAVQILNERVKNEVIRTAIQDSEKILFISICVPYYLCTDI